MHCEFNEEIACESSIGIAFINNYADTLDVFLRPISEKGRSSSIDKVSQETFFIMPGDTFIDTLLYKNRSEDGCGMYCEWSDYQVSLFVLNKKDTLIVDTFPPYTRFTGKCYVNPTEIEGFPVDTFLIAP
jgi:hypothetical protein